MTAKYVICSLHLLKTNCCSVSFSIFIDYTTTRANGMVFVVSCKNLNSSYWGKFDQEKQNLVWVTGNSSYPSKKDWKVGSNPREMWNICSS